MIEKNTVKSLRERIEGFVILNQKESSHSRRGSICPSVRNRVQSHFCVRSKASVEKTDSSETGQKGTVVKR